MGSAPGGECVVQNPLALSPWPVAVVLPAPRDS